MTSVRKKGLIAIARSRVCLAAALALAVWPDAGAVARGRQSARPNPLPVTSLEGRAGGVTSPSVQPPSRPPAGAPLPVTRLDDRGAAILDGARTVSLALSQPMPLANLLVLLVRGTPFSIVASETIAGTFVGDLKDLTMREALEAVLFPRDLDYDLQGTVIRVFAPKTTTRVYPIDYLNVTRTASSSVPSAAGLAGRRPAASVTASVGADRFDAIAKGVNALLSSSGRAQVDRIAGVIQVTDFADRLDRVGVYLETVQLRAARQVRLEARVFEVRIAGPSPAIDWKAIASRFGSGLSRRAAGITVSDPEALVSAIAEQGAVTMIAAPQLVTMNNEPAIVRVGTDEVYFSSTMEDDAGAGSMPRPSSVAVATGLTLNLVAQIAADGMVQLHIAPSLSEKVAESRSKNGDVVPVLRVGEADTVVRLKDGETFVLAGLLRRETGAKQETGGPGAVGVAHTEAATAELVVLLTPRVVGPAAETRGQH
jgi:type II secretory pathway component HofQ